MSHTENKKVMDALNKCAAECNHCGAACLDEQDVKMLTACIKLNKDCADICSLIASFVARGSDHARHVLKECAEICGACSEECGKHAHMEHCKVCSEVCRECAEACNAA